MNTKGKIYNSSEYEVSSQYIREHVEGYASIYGSYLEDGKITTRKLLVDNYEVEKIATGIMQFRKKELDIEERKFSFASVKENAKAVASFVKRSAKYAGDQTKKFFDSIMHKNLLALPSGEQTQENKRGIWDFLRRDPNLVNREEIMTMSEQFSEDDQLKKAKQKAEKNTKKINKLDIKVTNEEEQSYNDIFKRGITSETLKNIDDASKKAKENLNNIQKGSVQVSKEQSRVILGGEIEFE